MIERDNKRSWSVGKDDTGRAILVWGPGTARALEPSDESDCLELLDAPELAIVQDKPPEPDGSRNPYDSGP